MSISISTPAMPQPPRHIPYRSSDATVFFDPALCIHTGECTRGLPDVFRPKERPWVHTEKAAVDDLTQVICRCPSGALSIERHDGGEGEKPDSVASAAIRPNGPLHVRGRITLELEDGSTREMTRLALCRCGNSKNKPFCDNSHREVGFSDPGGAKPRENMPESLEVDRPVTLRMQKNGPVTFLGPVEVRTARGEVCFRGEKVSLCRCGDSQNKPFCDSSHKTNGFLSE